jgi:hypothetical protein
MFAKFAFGHLFCFIAEGIVGGQLCPGDLADSGKNIDREIKPAIFTKVWHGFGY